MIGIGRRWNQKESNGKGGTAVERRDYDGIRGNTAVITVLLSRLSLDIAHQVRHNGRRGTHEVTIAVARHETLRKREKCSSSSE